MPNYTPPGMEHEKNQIAIDFDGVIHNDNLGWHDGTCYGMPIQGSLEAIRELSRKYTIVIFSAKARKDRPLVNGKTGEELIWDWLEVNDVADYIEDVTARKPRAKFYIDDKAIRFQDWNQTLREVE